MEYALQHLIDIPRLQSLLDSLNDAFSFATAILGHDGEILTASGWQEICTRFHRANPTTARMCQESDCFLQTQIGTGKRTASYRCPMGLIDCATAIVINGKHMGNAFIGQVFLDHPDLTVFQEQARRYGFDEQAYLKAVERVPVLTQEQLDRNLAFIASFAEMLAEVGLSRLKEMETAENLEAQVEQRTAQLEQINALLRAEIVEKETAQRETLQAKEEWERTFDAITDPVMVLDKEFRIVKANRCICERLGIAPGKAVGQHCYSVVHGLDKPPANCPNLKLLEDGKPHELEVYQAKLAGDFRITVSPLHDAEGQLCGTVHYARDITERKKAEKEIADQKQLLEVFFENTLTCNAILDCKFNFVRVNNAYACADGRTPDFFTGLNHFDLYPSDARQIFERVVSTKEHVVVKARPFVYPDHPERGVTYWDWTLVPILDETGEVTKLIFTLSNVTEQCQTQEALRRSETSLKHAQRIAHLGSWDLDLQNNELLWSDEIYRIFGLQPQEFGATYEAFLETVHPGDRDSVNQAYSASIEHDLPYDIVHRIIRRSDKQIRFVHERCEHSKDESGRIIRSMGTVQDVTELHLAQERLHHQTLELEAEIAERQQAQEALARSERFLNTIIETEPECLKILDHEGRLQFMNRAGLDMIEADSLDQVKGRCVYPLIDEQYRDRFAGLTNLVFTGKSGNLEFEIHGLKGRRSWLDTHAVPFRNESDEVVALLGITRNITERKKAEESIRMLSQAVDQSPVSIVLADTHGDILFVNPKFAQLTGYNQEEVLGQNTRILKSEHTPREVHREIWAAISSGKVWDGVLQNKKKSGELFWEHATIAPILDDQGKITHYMAVKEDITERKVLEAQLLQSQKMEAIGHVVGGVAHDFNNILTAIIGFANLIEMRMEPDNPHRTNLKQILISADRAADLTRSLLAFSRKQIINPQPVNLNRIISGTQKFLQRIIGEDIELHTRFEQEILTVNADSGQIEQVLMNMATNARDAMPSGGVLTIETSRSEMDEIFVKRCGYGKPGVYVHIRVADTGMGMDESTCKSIFEPFFTTKEVGRGTGLGMSIVYGIIKQHEGFIDVNSRPGHGTEFNIYLPLIDAPLMKQTKPVEELPRGGTETILVADDDPALRELATRVLGQFGYTVITAEDGSDAMGKFEDNLDRIKLVILDVIMPRMNGGELLTKIRALHPDLPVLFFSGYTAEIIESRGLVDKGTEFLAKPLRPQDLLKKVRETLDRRR